MTVIRLWDYRRYRLRTCYSVHECRLCHGSIVLGQQYHDGGYGRRAHPACAEKDWERQIKDARQCLAQEFKNKKEPTT